MRFSFRNILILSVFLSLFGFLSFSLKNISVAEAKPQIPEVDGVYDDPDHPGVKVRVFVHKQKPEGNPGKPNPSPTPIPACIPTDDPPSSFVDGTTGWKLFSGWTYNLNPSSVPGSVGSGNLQTIAENAFAAWDSPTGLNFQEGPNTLVTKQAYDGVNIIAWGRTSGTALAVTYTRYYADTGEVVDVDTIMNKKFAWVWSSTPSCAIPGAYDAQNILTHELGHWVGLDDEYESPFADNTMFGYGSQGEVKKDTLTAGDTSAASNLYH